MSALTWSAAYPYYSDYDDRYYQSEEDARRAEEAAERAEAAAAQAEGSEEYDEGFAAGAASARNR
jgi:hypothetical protein